MTPLTANTQVFRGSHFVQQPSYSFTKAQRLLTASDYSAVFERNHAKASHRHLLLLARKHDGPQSRLGLVIAKKNVKLAVQRNRIKRLAREFFRQQEPLPQAVDVVLLARKGLGDLDNQTVYSILQQQWRRIVRHSQTPSTDNTKD